MRFRFIFSILAIFFLATGCATMPQATPQLDQAQQSYSQALADPQIARYAPVPLHDAGEALDMAQNAENEAERRHYAYLAEKRVELARALAAENAAGDRLKELRAQKEDILLKVRSSEAEQARMEAQQAQQEMRAYKSELAELQARETERGILLTMSNVLFATDKAELKPGAELLTAKLAAFLKEHPGRRILIEGHTDSRGPQEYNRKLSQKRAEAVAEALQAQGVDSGRITARGMGEEFPVAPNTTSAGRQQNRRVDIIIEKQEQQ